VTQLLLAAAHADILEQLAWTSVLLAFDFDGTLAPIVADPDAAAMRARTHRLLGDVARLYPTIVISGRARADVIRRVEGVPLATVLGNHGAEPSPDAARYRRSVERWRRVLERALSGVQGVVIEDKRFSLAVHYRQSRQRVAARKAILAAAEGLGRLRIVGGKLVVNLVPDDAPHKGLALAAERRRLACDTALYVGDDDTDEDVFARDEPGRLIGVRIGVSRRSDAPYALRAQTDIDVLLARLATLRRKRVRG
jgi:trehalose 6-phosphate phosphatase